MLQPPYLTRNRRHQTLASLVLVQNVLTVPLLLHGQNFVPLHEPSTVIPLRETDDPRRAGRVQHARTPQLVGDSFSIETSGSGDSTVVRTQTSHVPRPRLVHAFAQFSELATQNGFLPPLRDFRRAAKPTTQNASGDPSKSSVCP